MLKRKVKEKCINRNVAVFMILVLLLCGFYSGGPAFVEAARNTGLSDRKADAGGNVTLSNPKTDGTTGIVTYDCIWFGSYRQSDAKGAKKTPIKWRVLSVNGKDAFLVADKILDMKSYDIFAGGNETDTYPWETCTMRSWLNGYDSTVNRGKTDYSGESFIDTAFTDAEKKAIKTTQVKEKESGGSLSVTEDKVFLLSKDEVVNPAYGFYTIFDVADPARVRERTDYIKGKYGEDRTNSKRWRLLGYENGVYGFAVEQDGTGSNCYVDSSLGVCPALHLDLSDSTLWSYAGTVATDGTEDEVPPVFQPDTRVELSSPKKKEDGTVTYDCIWFGRYPQYDILGKKKEPIKWRVLSVDGDDAFLVADKQLDAQPYNRVLVDHYDEDTAIYRLPSWADCTMRSWLNGYGADKNVDKVNYNSDNFIDKAFTDAEKDAIKTTDLPNDVQDKVFLLTKEDVTNKEYGFVETNEQDKARELATTSYAMRECDDSGNRDSSRQYKYGWWLRSDAAVGNGMVGVSYVYLTPYSYDTKNTTIQDKQINQQYGVCPALHLDLSVLDPDIWSYAGTVSTDGTEDEKSFSLVSEPKNKYTYNGRDYNSIGSCEYDCVWFGSYPNSDEEGAAKEPIKWRVLSVDGDDALLIADKCLEEKKSFIEGGGSDGWRMSTIRSWLNGYGGKENQKNIDYSNDNFVKTAFTEEEIRAINTAYLKDAYTEDRVFLLSYDELFKNTDYFYDSYPRIRKGRNGSETGWWSRTDGGASFIYTYTVQSNGNEGYLYSYRNGQYYDQKSGVCPALHLNLAATDQWSYAGTVTVNSYYASYTEVKPTYQVTVNVTKEGKTWNDHGREFYLKDNKTPSNTYTNISEKVPKGTYSLYDATGKTNEANYVDTGVDVEVNGSGARASVDYYTITFYDGDTPYGDNTAYRQQFVISGQKAKYPGNAVKSGYSFSGWMADQEGQTQFNFNNGITKSTSVYAKWQDETPPKFGTVSGCKKLGDWMIQKDAVITVPVIEQGSGIQKAEYTLKPEDGTEETKEVGITEEDGKTVAKIPVTEEFKGTVSMRCTDKDGNDSGMQKIGDFIVENHAPEISARLADDTELSGWLSGPVTVKINVDDAVQTAGEQRLTGGIAKVIWKLDDGAETEVADKGFENSMISSCDFDVEIADAGFHTLMITAVDNAGNETTKNAAVNIIEQQKNPEITIDYETERLNGFISQEEYTIEGKTVKILGDTTKSIDLEWFGKQISIVRKGNGESTADSETVFLAIPNKPSGPSVTATDASHNAEDGAIAGMTDKMEYRRSEDSTWIKVTSDKLTNDTLTGLAAGNYEVRYQATAEQFASEIVDVTINAKQDSRPDTEKVEEAKEKIEGILPDILGSFHINNSTLPDALGEDISKAVKQALKTAEIDGISVTVGSLTKTEATAEEEGKVTGIITIQSGSASDSVTFECPIAKLPVTDKEKVAVAKGVVESVIGKNRSVKNNTRLDKLKDDIKSEIDAGLKGAGIEGVTVTVGELVKKEATQSEAGSITGTITIESGTETDSVAVNLTIAKLPENDTEKVEAAKEWLVEVLPGILADLQADNSTDPDELRRSIDKCIAEMVAEEEMEGVTITVGTLEKRLATTEAAGSIKGAVTIQSGTETVSVSINQPIAKLPVTDAEKVGDAKKKIEEVLPEILAGFNVNNNTQTGTLQTDIRKAIEQTLAEAGMEDVTVTVGTLTKKDATATAEGSITGTITIQSGTETVSVPISQSIAKLPMTDAEKVADAKVKAEAALPGILAGLNVSNSTQTGTLQGDIKEAVEQALKAAGVEGAVVTVGTLIKKDATTTAEGSITGTITIRVGDKTQSITINKAIAKLSTTAANTIKADTSFRALCARVTKTTKTSNTLTWSNVKGADGYIIYGKKNAKLAEVKASVTKYKHTKLKKGTYYQYVVKAYKLMDGEKAVIASSKVVYSTTDGGKFGNAKSIKVRKSTVKLKKGRTFNLKASVVKKNRKIKTYRKLAYESSNTKVATVSKKGVIKAKKKGTCTIYVYAQNGVYKKVKIIVK